jgi:hypothetical protein
LPVANRYKNFKKVDSSDDKNAVIKIISDFRTYYMSWKTDSYRSGAPAPDIHEPNLSGQLKRGILHLA